MNFLERLLIEWYMYNGYFVKQNVKVGKRKLGGYEGELDIIAFNPLEMKLIHLEPSTDSHSWDKREIRFRKKFDLGNEFIPTLFEGLNLPEKIEQRAVFLRGSNDRKKIGGGDVFWLKDYLKEIEECLSVKNAKNEIVPENYTLLRTLHLYIDYKSK
jgi:hypothetical protein